MRAMDLVSILSSVFHLSRLALAHSITICDKTKCVGRRWKALERKVKMSNSEIRNSLKITCCKVKYFIWSSRNARSKSSHPCTRSIRCTAKCSGVRKINPVSIAVRLHNLWRASKATEWGKSSLGGLHGAHSETCCIQANSFVLAGGCLLSD